MLLGDGTQASEIQRAGPQGNAHRLEANGSGYSSPEGLQKVFSRREPADVNQSSAEGASPTRDPSPYRGGEANDHKDATTPGNEEVRT